MLVGAQSIHNLFITRDEMTKLTKKRKEVLAKFDKDNLYSLADAARIVKDIAARLKARGRDEWLAIFQAARVPAGPIYRLDEIGQDAALRQRRFLYGFDRGGERVPQVGLGIAVDGGSEGCRPHCWRAVMRSAEETRPGFPASRSSLA